MTPNDDFIGQLEGYLDEYEGSTPLPGEVRDVIRSDLPKIRQIGPLPGPMRFLTMTMHVPAVRFGLVAAAMVAAVVVGASFLSGGTGGPPDSAPSALPLATPGVLPTAAALEPGTYVAANPYEDRDPVRSCERGCADYRSITFTVPDGWASVDGLVVKHLDEPNEVAFSIWTPGDIYLDPCRWQTSDVGPDPSAHVDSPGGEIVLDDQYPLRNQVGRSAAAPTNVMIGGQRAWRFELSLSDDLDISACDQGEFRTWTEWDVPGGANAHHAAGQVDRVYYVDVDRRPLFIDASYMPGASAANLAELEAILDSMYIARGNP